MADLEKFWRNAPGSQLVCTKSKVTKNMILNAITYGAETLDDLKKELSLCAHNECKAMNINGRGCEENANAILSIYVPIFCKMKEGLHRGLGKGR